MRSRRWVAMVVVLSVGVFLSCSKGSRPAPNDTAADSVVDYPRPEPAAEHVRPAVLDAPKPVLDPALPSYQPIPHLEGTLKGGCSTTMPDVLRGWISRFTEIYPDVHIEFISEGGKVAAWDLAEGTIDFAGVTREIDPYGLEKFVSKFGYEPLEIPISGGSFNYKAFTDTVVFFVHKDNPIEGLSFSQLDAIYSSSRKRGHPEPITTWGQVGLTGEWADKPIHVWGVKPWNGYEKFTGVLVLDDGVWRQDINFEPKVIPLADTVAADPNAIAYASLAWLNDGVKTISLAVSDDGPYVEPNFEEVLSRNYPLSRLIYIYANQPPGEALDPALREFLRFVASKEGQQEVVEDGIYLPLTPEIARISQSRLE